MKIQMQSASPRRSKRYELAAHPPAKCPKCARQLVLTFAGFKCSCKEVPPCPK